VSKNGTDVAHYNFVADQPIVMTEKTQFPGFMFMFLQVVLKH